MDGRTDGRTEWPTVKRAGQSSGMIVCTRERTINREETNKRRRVPMKGRIYGDGGEGKARSGRTKVFI